MANAWKRDKASGLRSPRFLLLLLSVSLILIFIFFSLTSRPSSPSPGFLAVNTHLSFHAISPFDCIKSPQAHPVVASTVEGVRYPFLYSLSDFGNLPDKPHKNIVRILKGKPFRKPDISVTIQEVLERMKSEGRDGFVVDVGANVGMASFAASAMGFRAAASDRLGEITFHKLVGRLDNSAVSATGAKLAFQSNEEVALQVKSVPLDEVIPESEQVLLLKIDVQGWEYHVLKGALKLLSRKASEAPYLIYEEDERLLKASNSSAKEIRDFLKNVGYHDCTQHGTDAHCTKKAST
ncbi:hypothetical protein K1719_002925 [Acacia pycnantha]|nr:hypothetical protein K1719_002925 [Acacia pycnantha]